MTKINIITIHKEPNYGATLQAFALYHIVEQLGYTPNIIDLSMIYRRFKPTPFNRFLMWTKNKVKGYDYAFEVVREFQEQNCPNHTKNFDSVEELFKYPWHKADKYLVGSDQVWNPDITQRLTDAFTLSFLPKDFCKYSYAASLGNIKDEAERARQLDIASLRTFRRIAVRERFGVDFLAKQGISAIEVIDPTLLIDDYRFLLRRAIKPSGKMLFLSLSDTVEMNQFVAAIAQSKHLSVDKHYGYLQPQRAINRKFLKVEEWLQKIAESSLVVTDSFHAMVFSILFHREFFVYISEPSKVYRIANILQLLGIEGRVVSSAEECVNVKPIDYSSVDKRLVEYRKESLVYLKEILAES